MSLSISTTLPFSGTSPLSPTLQNLPAELLLIIIAYLPASSYAPLTQTSHTLQAFFANYASKICSQRILSHFSAEVAILKASFAAVDSMGNTWLVPTHEAVLRAEENLWDREGSISSLRFVHPNEEALALQKRMRLSQPGPQFLLFLERRGWEVQTRHRMMEDKMQMLQDTTKLEPWSSERERGEMQLNSFLSWSLERGVVRGFLEELSTFAEALAYIEQPLEEEVYEKPTSTIKDRLRSTAKTLKAKLGKLGQRKAKAQPERSYLLFGEIPGVNEKSEVLTKELKANGLSEGLWWYHGQAGVSGYPPLALEEFVQEQQMPRTIVEKEKLKNCIRAMTKNVSRTGRKMRDALNVGWKCGTSNFESLD
jgi:hypothetical protein